jgi:hypothetical protein
MCVVYLTDKMRRSLERIMDNRRRNSESHEMEPAPHETALDKSVGTLQRLYYYLLAGTATVAVIILLSHFQLFDEKRIVPPSKRAWDNSYGLIARYVALAAMIAAMLHDKPFRQYAVRRLAAKPVSDTTATQLVLVNEWQSCNLIRAGVLEATAILNLIAFLLFAQFACLAVAGTAFLLLLFCIPNHDSGQRWVDTAQEELERVRTHVGTAS